MRAKLIMAIAAVMCLTLAGAEEKNLLVNPGFEDGSWRGGPTSWNVTYGNWKIVDGGLENSKALEVSSVNVPEHKKIKISFVQAIDNPVMGKYLLKGNLKGEFTEVLTVLSSPKMEPQVTVLKKDQCPQKDGWNSFEVKSSIPEGAGTVSMVIEVWTEKEGVPVLFDNISLQLVGGVDAGGK